jgi:N-acetylglutamate synthase/N-acetylornithine aminotransferase
MDNLEKYAVKELDPKTITKVNGGNWGRVAVAIGSALWLEVRDAWEDGSLINEDAYNQGRKLGQDAIS